MLKSSRMVTAFTLYVLVGLVVLGTLSSQMAAAQQVPGQMEESALPRGGAEVVPGQVVGEQGTAVQPSITQTTLTFRSHQISAGASAGNLEGNACPGGYTMISGACHPGYNDRVIIINQFPNRFANTWRCGFKNNDSTTRTVWIYTLCGQ